MARGFNEHERQVITQALIEQGRKLFRKFGFQKTSIHEMTKKVGIAQGTFYKFFRSKEELYFTILEMEEQKLREHLMNMNVHGDVPPKAAFKQMLQEMIHAIETNPLIRELYAGSTMKDMMRRLPPHVLETHFTKDSEALEALIEKWKSLGVHVKEDPALVSGVLRSLFLLPLRKEEIGAAVYRDTVDLLISLIADGLIEEE